MHQWYLHISNYFEEDAKWSVASVQWTDLPFIFVASFLRSPFSSAPAAASFPSHYPFFRRRFAFVLSHKYMSAHRCRGIDPSILSQLHSPVSPVSKELTGGVSPWQTDRETFYGLSSFYPPLFFDTTPDSFNIRLPSNICRGVRWLLSRAESLLA